MIGKLLLSFCLAVWDRAPTLILLVFLLILSLLLLHLLAVTDDNCKGALPFFSWLGS